MEQHLHTCYSEPSSPSSSSSSGEEDYINMEVDHYSSFDSSIFTTKEFEFQSFSSSSDRDLTTTSPADELFCMGKLLPLHLPPRLEMVHKILQNSTSFDANKHQNFEDESFSTPLFTPASNTPFESCNISPEESREVSRELNPNEHFVEHLAGVEKKSWTKKLKMIKQSSGMGIGSKLKWTNLKYLFTKSSGCSDEYSAVADHTQVSKVKQYVDCHWKAAPFGEIRVNKGDAVEGQRGGGHRRSFSGAFKRLSKAKPASGSVSGVEKLNRNALKRSVRSSAESESPIQAAIAHCKRSQNSRQIDDETTFCSISGSSRVLYDYSYC